ncbi:MAG: tyrosine-protein phosphatase [Bacteroidales bacterium]|nr:tyrosine-protein phosphatase [Bacteroidales bacterium]
MRAIKDLLLFLLVLPIFISSCYDDAELWERIRDHEYRITKLEDFCSKINSNLVSLHEVVVAIQAREYVKDVIPIYDEGLCIGYTITFNGRNPITLFNGKNGTDAQTPIIGIKKEADGAWYWTLNGNWLLDESGSRVIASGKDGREVNDGTNGITPQLKIENDYWWISYNDGESWVQLGLAFDRENNNECSVIKSITQDQHFVTIVLANGEIIQLTKQNSARCQSENPHNIENIGVQVYKQVVYNSNDYSYTCIGYMASALARPYNQIPNGKIIKTDVDASAQSRYLEYADNADYINSNSIQLDLSSEKYVLYNLEGDKIYYYRIYKDNDPYLLLNSGMFETSGSIRQLKIDTSSGANREWLNNVRDIGGWQVGNNRRIRYGVIFRGPEFNHIKEGEESILISDSGIKELKRLGVSAELDLRTVAEISGHEYSVLGSDVVYLNQPVDQWFYRLNIYFPVKKNASYYADAIRHILSCLRENRGVYIHCAGGCDRTGALCAIIEGLCGVSENDINHDYELSNRDRSREYYALAKGAKYDGDFKFAMEYIKGLVEYNGHIYVFYRQYYYDTEKNVDNYLPAPISDEELIHALNNCHRGTFQDRFRLLMKIGGLSMQEMLELESFLCS